MAQKRNFSEDTLSKTPHLSKFEWYKSIGSYVDIHSIDNYQITNISFQK